MDNEIFPWNPNRNAQPALPHIETPVIRPTPLYKKYFEILRPALPYLGAALVLLAMYCFTQSRASPAASFDPATQTIDVFTPLFAIQKGEEVPLDALRMIPVRKSLFTKTQLFGLMNPENIQDLRGRLIAKKSLFPNKAVSWNDLELKKTPRKKTDIKILYSNGAQP